MCGMTRPPAAPCLREPQRPTPSALKRVFLHFSRKHGTLRRGRDRPRMRPLPRLRHRMPTRLPPYRPRPVTAPAGSNIPVSSFGAHDSRPWTCHDSRFTVTVGYVPADLETRCRLRVQLLRSSARLYVSAAPGEAGEVRVSF